MKSFLKEIEKDKKYELLIDTKIFSKDIILKSSYNFLDKGYFFFNFDNEKNIILGFTKKENINENSEKILGDFSDELLSVYLRNKLEKENKKIRETIVSSAISNSLDSKSFVEINTDITDKKNDNSQIDFDKDIEEILKEIENDPDLKIDEAEIEKILKEIEEESKIEDDNFDLKLNIEGVKDQKKKFKK